MASGDRMIMKNELKKDKERDGRGIIKGIAPAFT
jgi:hypothetical protein